MHTIFLCVLSFSLFNICASYSIENVIFNENLTDSTLTYNTSSISSEKIIEEKNYKKFRRNEGNLTSEYEDTEITGANDDHESEVIEINNESHVSSKNTKKIIQKNKTSAIKSINFTRNGNESSQVISNSHRMEPSFRETNETYETTTISIASERAISLSATIMASTTATSSTDIKFIATESEFPENEVQRPSVSSEITITEANPRKTTIKMNFNSETTIKIAIVNVVHQNDITNSVIFETKYLYEDTNVQMLKYSIVMFSVICIGYLLMKLRKIRQFKTSLKRRSRRLHLPYRLDQSNERQIGIELIVYLDFRELNRDDVET